MSVGLEVAGVAGVQPAVFEAFARGLFLLEVAAEDAAGADQDFAGVADP